MCIWVYLASVPLFVPNPPACCFKVLQSCTNIQSAQKLKQEGEDKLSRAYFVTQHKQMYGTQRRGDHDQHSFQACCDDGNDDVTASSESVLTWASFLPGFWHLLYESSPSSCRASSGLGASLACVRTHFIRAAGVWR